MYYATVPTGIGQISVATPILSTAPARAAHAVLVGPRRVWTRGPKGGLLVRKRGDPGTWQPARRRVGSTPNGIGCGCSGMQGCGCSGMGPAQSLSQVAGDFTTVLQDAFLNSDGSLNWAAVTFAGFGAILIFVNWGNTTKKRYGGKH